MGGEPFNAQITVDTTCLGRKCCRHDLLLIPLDWDGPGDQSSAAAPSTGSSKRGPPGPLTLGQLHDIYNGFYDPEPLKKALSIPEGARYARSALTALARGPFLADPA